ncbi:MLO-like protein 6 [Tripterygium wilfordii]|uniref:MLO-like protein n=1 Tax=Tripterygium wilfordii TaxID=458696 RepID=A0A7J7D838_TRIWF|nr:MLO-like protein 6 [Tripterygium wilfordii]KAF5742530.1 MLO-like protein 6 [Tripterygium wilfordii]
MATREKEKSLEETSTWAVAIVCFVLVLISLLVEHGLHLVGKWLKGKNKRALFEALEKVKAELMLMGFISLLLTIGQEPISQICISKSIGATWHPCPGKSKTESSEEESENGNGRRKLLQFLDFGSSHRRNLAEYYDQCAENGQVAFVSAYAIHQLHVFIFVLAITHILYCILTLALGRTKMRKWRVWEDETKTVEYQYYNDPERFRFARDTSFGRRHLHKWSESSFFLWIVCFFRQFLGSITKVDYMTLRHGFITAHLAPGSGTRFNFQKYISRSLEEDFVVVVGITPLIWFIAVLFLLTNTHGWHASLWLPFLPLIVILLVGAKLQVIITKMGLRIQHRGDVVKGAPLVEPGDDLFWFGRPRFLLFLIHLVLFQNAFQLAFFAFSWYKFGLKSCFHHKNKDIAIRISMGILIQILCSYVTLPLYALVTQMGSNMRPTIFNDRVAAALKNWHHTAKKHTKHSKHPESHSPMSSRPTTPTHGMSPMHLLQNYRSSTAVDSYHASPTHPNYYDSENWDPEAPSPRTPPSPPRHNKQSQNTQPVDVEELEMSTHEPSSTQLPPAPHPIRTQHDIRVHSSDFSFEKREEM